MLIDNGAMTTRLDLLKHALRSSHPKPRRSGPPLSGVLLVVALEVFALDRQLDLRPGAGRQDVLDAMWGHVLAGGEIQGLFARPDRPAKP
jgi:hypothetical protein